MVVELGLVRFPNGIVEYVPSELMEPQKGEL